MPSWKKVILSGSDAVLNSLDVTTDVTITGSLALSGSLIDYLGNPGTAGQMILSTGTGIEWAPNVAESAQSLIITGKNVTASPIPKGTPVFFTGSGTSGNLVGVIPADAGNSNLMPAGGVLAEAIAAGAEGGVYIYGYISDVNTSAFAAGDDVFVAVGGGYTNVKPTGSALIQKLGNVEKVSALNGSGVIQGPSWYNDLPNVQSGYTWVGNINSVPQAVSTASLFVTSASYAISASFAPNIYNSDGVITAPRVVTLDGENLTFETQTGGGFDINLFDTGSFSVNYINNQSAFRIVDSPTQTIPKLLGLDSNNKVVNMATSSIQNVVSSSFASTASFASNALTASYGAANFTTAGDVYINGNTEIYGYASVESINLIDPNSSGFSTTSASSSIVPNGNTVTLFTIGAAGYEAVFLDYVVFNSARTNKRTGNFRINFDLTANAVTYDETSTKDIGNTSGFTLFAEVVGSVMSMKATNNTGQNVQIVYERKILYIV